MPSNNFDWNEYHCFSDRLLNSDLGVSDEAKCRIAVSRYYYAIFNLAKEKAEKIGFKIEGNAEDHGRLSQWLEERQSDPNCAPLGNNLRKMRRYRNECDYAPCLKNISFLIDMTQKLCKGSIDLLSNIDS